MNMQLYPYELNLNDLVLLYELKYNMILISVFWQIYSKPLAGYNTLQII